MQQKGGARSSQRIAAGLSPSRSRRIDPELLLHKYGSTTVVRIKAHHSRTPDVGIGIRIFMPCYRAGDGSSEMIEYYGEYLGHGQSKTAFELHSPGARFHGKVLKVARKYDMEPDVFARAAEYNLS